MNSQSSLKPPYAQRLFSTGGEAGYGASRKSARRDNAENHPSGVSLNNLPPFPSSPQLPIPFDTHNNASSGTGLDPPQMFTGSDVSSWGVSLSPRMYTATCRAAEQEGLHSNVTGSFHYGWSPAAASSSTITPPPPQLQQQEQTQSYRKKRRRVEQVSVTSLYEEVFMYLDAVSATQQDYMREVEEGKRTLRFQGGGGAEEDVRAEKDRMRGGDNGSVSIRILNSNSDITTTNAAAAASPSGLRSSVTPLIATHYMSVDAAVVDTLRVLRACWEYRGAPHDAFEPVRLLSPITVHLLTTYGRHTITHDGEYVVLRGGAEQLPWVGCLYGVLQSYADRRQQHQSPDSAGANELAEPIPSPVTADASGGSSSPPSLNNVSRVLLLNCHSFGWLDHVGTDEYERSHRRLYQAREALISLLEDERYAALGWHTACPLCSSAMVGGDASTSVLLGDTIVMEGGVPSLGLASSRDTFTAHYQYGRGIACCVPEQQQLGLLRKKNAQRAGPHDKTVVNSGSESRESSIRSGLCAMHQALLEESQQRGSGRWPAQPFPTTYHTEEEYTFFNNSSSSNSYVTPAMPHASPPSPSSCYHPYTPTVNIAHFPPVCCGTCRAAGVLGQALLLGPTGPLLIHLQFEEREWLEAAAPLLGCASFCDSAGHSSGWPWLETTALCPAPHAGIASLRTDSAGALAAVLYAQMQGRDMTGATQNHRPLNTAGGALGASHGSSGLTSNGLPSSFSRRSPNPLWAVPGCGAVSLAEFVEWLVRLLHAPTPALVVEWHSCVPTYPLRGKENPNNSSGSGDYPAGVDPVLPTSVASCGSPSPYPEYATAPHTQAYAAAVASMTHSSSASSVEVQSQHAPQQPSFHLPWLHGGQNNSSKDDNVNNSGSLQHPSPSSVPLGISVRPRLAVVPQLLEAYADVMESRPPTSAQVPNSGTKDTDKAAVSLPTPVVSGAMPSLGTHYSLQSTLTRAAQEVLKQDQMLLEWVLAAQSALRPCEAAAYFDGVERPLVLAKGLEVVAEGERYIGTDSVVTSLQFRPHPNGLRDHRYESIG